VVYLQIIFQSSQQILRGGAGSEQRFLDLIAGEKPVVQNIRRSVSSYGFSVSVPGEEKRQRAAADQLS
jgi:hypothetical protein